MKYSNQWGRIRISLSVVISSLITALIGIPHHELEAQDWKSGDTIVITEDTDLLVGTEKVARITVGTLVTINQVNKQWLWLNSDPAGWIDQKSVSSVPEYLNDQNAKADELKKSQNFELAREIYDRVLSIDPRNERALLNRADTYYGQKDYEASIEGFTVVEQEWPRNKDVYFWRGDAYYQLKLFEKAIEDYSKGMSLVTPSASHFISRCNAYVGNKDWDNAIVDVTVAISLSKGRSPESLSQNHAGRAMYWEQKKDAAAAVADYLTAAQLAPKNRAANLEKAARILATSTDDKIRNGKRAVQLALDAAKSMNQPDARVLATLAAGYAEVGDYVTAVKFLERSITQSDESSKAARIELLEIYKSKLTNGGSSNDE